MGQVAGAKIAAQKREVFVYRRRKYGKDDRNGQEYADIEPLGFFQWFEDVERNALAIQRNRVGEGLRYGFGNGNGLGTNNIDNRLTIQRAGMRRWWCGR